MAKLDRLGWTAGLSFTAYGTRFGIRTNAPDLVSQLPQYLPLGWQPNSSAVVDMLYSLRIGQPTSARGVRHYHLLYAGAGRLARSLEIEVVLAQLEQHVQLMTAYLADGFLFVHAGVVGWQGQAILFPGRSFAGKTTLVKALVEGGATYYSDEFAVLDPQGLVHPYPRPLSIRDQTGQNAQQKPVEALGGRAGREPLPVGLVVATEYQAGARWQPQPLSPGETVLELMANTVSARRNPAEALPILKQTVIGAQGIKTKRGEANQVIKPILAYLEKQSGLRRSAANEQTIQQANQLTNPTDRRRKL